MCFLHDSNTRVRALACTQTSSRNWWWYQHVDPDIDTDPKSFHLLVHLDKHPLVSTNHRLMAGFSWWSRICFELRYTQWRFDDVNVEDSCCKESCSNFPAVNYWSYFIWSMYISSFNSTHITRLTMPDWKPAEQPHPKMVEDFTKKKSWKLDKKKTVWGSKKLHFNDTKSKNPFLQALICSVLGKSSNKNSPKWRCKMVTYHATIRKTYQKSESKLFFKAPKKTEKPSAGNSFLENLGEIRDWSSSWKNPWNTLIWIKFA